MELLTTYEILKLIWWGLIGIVLIGFAITDGYDMGSAGLLTYLGKKIPSVALLSTPSPRTGMVTRSG